MKHFLVTRFNLKIEQWTTAKDNLPVLTEEWLENRFGIFQTYCLPSVMNQRNQNFTWAVFFDIDTPDSYKGRIEKMAQGYPNFHPQFVDGIASFISSFKEFIQKNIGEGDNYIITSRLDNDDAVHQDFIDTIQNLAIPRNETVIDLQRGYQMNITDNVHEYRGKYYYPFNPFISLVEEAAGFQTVFKREHPQWREGESIISYREKPLWIEVVHKKNKYNYVKPDLPLIRKIKLDEFGISKRLRERGYLYIISNNVVRKIKRFGWKTLMKLKKS